MRITAIELENYGSFYGTHRFPCADRGLTIVLGENLDEPRMNSNGAAKSTLFEGLDWCWYGKVPKGDHVDSVVNEECKRCSVTTYLQDDNGVEAVIKRSRPPGLQFWVDGVEMTCLDAAETQTDIIKFLGMTREVFHAAVFFGQEDLMRFADVGEARRMELLSQIIPEMGETDELLEVVKDRHAFALRKQMGVQNTVADLSGQLGALQSLDYQQQHAEWEQKRKAEMAALHQRSAELHAYWKENTPKLARLAVAEAEVAKAMAEQLPQPVAPALLQELEQKRLEAHSYARVVQNEVGRVQAELRKVYATQEGRCSQCGQQVTQEHLAAEVARLQQQEQQATQAFQAASHAQADLDRQRVEAAQQHDAVVQQWRHEQQAQKARTHELQQEVAQLKQLEGYCKQVERDVQDTANRATALGNQVNPFDGEIQKLRQRQFDLTQKLRAEEAVLAGIDEGLAYLAYWIKAFGPKGLKSYILDSKLQEMTDSANHWVKVLTGGTFWVKFSTQKEGRSTKKLSNDFNIQVYRYNPDGRVSERSYRSWSGGEKGRVSLAIDMGLSRLIAQRARKRYDVLILDELFKHVDRDGGEAVVEMLTKLRHEKSSVFVIEHDAEFQARFENRVLVRRKGARSTIVELDHELQCDRQTPPPIPEQRKKKPKRAPIRRSVQADSGAR